MNFKTAKALRSRYRLSCQVDDEMIEEAVPPLGEKRRPLRRCPFV
jgi:hypothetical protein